MTILEVVMAMTLITIIFAAVLPQFRAIHNSWDSKQGNAEVLQNGRVLIDHINRNLSKAVKITAVSGSAETDGYIEFEDNDSNSWRYDIADNNYIEFGLVGNLSDLAGPVSSLLFTCYDSNDFSNPITDVNFIRLVDVQTILPNPAALGQSKTFTTSAYLRTNWNSSSSGLVGWWKLDETSGTTAADSSGNGNDGTLINMGSSGWTTGAVGGALEFDGNNDYVSLPIGSVINSLTNCTIALWVNWDGGGGYWQRCWDFGSSESDNMFLTVNNSYTDTPRFAITTTGWWDEDQTTAPDSLSGGWHHLTVTIDADSSIHSLYVDGELVEENTSARYTPSDLGSTSQNWLARSQYSADPYFNGRLDDVRIYNRVLSDEEIEQLATILRYSSFTEAKVGSDSTSITISTPGSGGAVSMLGSWTSGLTHTAEAGSNRLLVLTAHVEDNDADISLDSVTYGGQSMTKVVEREVQESSTRAYVVAYVLDEAGIAAASGNAFSPSWSSTPDDVAYSSVFLAGVDQDDPTGASDSDGTTSSSTISTSSLSTNEGDMVIVVGTAGNSGSYSLNNGFTQAIELTIPSADGVAGYKVADSSSETPSITHSNPNRQVIIGFVVQTDEGSISGIEGDLLIAAVATDGDTSSSLAPPEDEGWTEIDVDDYSGAVTLGAWWKLADASESPSHQFTWWGDEQSYGWMMRFTGHDSSDPIDVYLSSGESSSTPTSPAVTTTVDNCLILRLGAFDDDDITIDDPGLSGHTAITMDESSSGGSGTVSILGSWTSGLMHAAEAGSNRLLILTAHVEDDDADMSLDSVTYGGQSMIKVIERETQESSSRAYVVAYILNEAGVAAATSDTFSPSWSSTPDQVDYSSVFLEGVDQDGPIGASDSDGSNSSSTIWTSALSTNDGDMVIVAGTTGNPGSYTVNNGFTEALELSMGSSDGVAGYKAANGSSETPSVTHSNPQRQVIIGFVVQVAELSNTVSGGAGYIMQSSSGDSGTSDFSLGSSNEAQMLTIAIAPDSSSSGGSSGIIRP